jgi:hypothetical protein
MGVGNSREDEEGDKQDLEPVPRFTEVHAAYPALLKITSMDHKFSNIKQIQSIYLYIWGQIIQ